MQVELATYKIIPAWIELAREVEPLFEGSMAEDDGFHKFMKRRIKRSEALMICDESHSDELMGLIAFSRNNNVIAWLAVFEKHRRKGIGSELLEHALKDLDGMKEISVTTFREDSKEGLPARQLFQKYGFIDFDTNAFYDGHPRCVMKRPPQI